MDPLLFWASPIDRVSPPFSFGSSLGGYLPLLPLARYLAYPCHSPAHSFVSTRPKKPVINKSCVATAFLGSYHHPSPSPAAPSRFLSLPPLAPSLDFLKSSRRSSWPRPDSLLQRPLLVANPPSPPLSLASCLRPLPARHSRPGRMLSQPYLGRPAGLFVSKRPLLMPHLF